MANTPTQHCVHPGRHTNHSPLRHAASAKAASTIWMSAPSAAGSRREDISEAYRIPCGAGAPPANCRQISTPAGCLTFRLFGISILPSSDDKVFATEWRPCMPGVIARLLVVLCVAASACAQVPAVTAAAAPSVQTEADEYTRYELLSPESASFAIHYEVTATTAGAKYYFNPIRKGSVASGESVIDLMTGQPLRFVVVNGEDAVKDTLMKDEDASVDYIKVSLARTVPPDGQARLLILKTYKDAKSYYREGDKIVFNRSLSIPRNSVVLPAGYELVACNMPSQVLAVPDGRIAISFMNGSGAEAPLVVKGKLGAQTGAAAVPQTSGSAKSWEAPFEGETEKERLSERAHEDREIVYFLQQPETHAFRLYHDYTESRPGTDKYS